MKEQTFISQVDKIVLALELQKFEIFSKTAFEYGTRIDLIDPLFKHETILFFDSKGVIRLNYNRSNTFLERVLLEALSEYQIILEITNVRYIGIDESGKGDYLGPLVIAGFISDHAMDKELIKMGVKDCKLLSDQKVIDLALELRKKFDNAYTVFPYEPVQYNKEYSILRTQGLNMTEMLKKGQCEVIKRLVERDPLVDGVIADSISNFDNALSSQLAFGRKLNVLHESNAERNPAVAAAGVLARAYFLNWLKEKSALYTVELHKGADAQTINSCLKMIALKNPEILKEIAKLHFKTTQKVMEKVVGKR